MPSRNVDDLRLRREALQNMLAASVDEAAELLMLRLSEELVRGFLAGKGMDSTASKPRLQLV